MAVQDSAFVAKIRKLKPPSSATFDPAHWIGAFDSVADPGVQDQRLLDTAMWIGAEMAALEAEQLLVPLKALSGEWSTVLAIAALNREFRTASDLAEDRGKAAIDAGVLSVDTLAAIRIEGVAGQEISVSALAEVATDAAENWLFDAAQGPGGKQVPPSDVGPVAAPAGRYYSYRKTLNVLWNQALCEGWHVADLSGDDVWSPGDLERERLKLAWQSRQEANLNNFPNIDRSHWPKLPVGRRKALARRFGVVEVRLHKDSLKVKVGALHYHSKRLPAYVHDKAMLEGSYLAEFLDSAFPIDERLSARLLLEAWHTLLDLANLLAAMTPLPDELSPEHARRLAMAVERGVLVETLKDALRVPAETADVIVTFLTFTFQVGGTKKAKGNRGLWGAPLVCVPGSSELLLSYPVLATSHPTRKAEAWLEKGGINDDHPTDARGDRYEALYRRQLAVAMERNKVFKTARCSLTGVSKSPSFNEQIDMIAAFGGLCLVGEVKFFLMPTDPHERLRYDEKLRGAAEQATRKAAALETNRGVLASALGITRAEADDLRLIPLIVTNQGYGLSSLVDGVRVLEAEFLRTYLGDNEIVTGMAFVQNGGASPTWQRTTLYADEALAARTFETSMASPYVLTRFLDRVKWTASVFPTLVHQRTAILSPILDDLQGPERWQAQQMIRDLEKLGPRKAR